MKRIAKQVVRYGRSFKEHVVYAVVRDGISIAKVCSLNGIDEMYKVREWVRAYMKKKGMIKIPGSPTRNLLGVGVVIRSDHQISGFIIPGNFRMNPAD